MRFEAGWGVLARIVIIVGFVIPFLALLFRAAKRSSIVMALVGCLLVVVHFLDVYWMLMPTVQRQWVWAGMVWNVGAIALVGGASAALAIWRSTGRRSVAVGDPLLEWSLRYQAR